jgi:hypothetical protein
LPIGELSVFGPGLPRNEGKMKIFVGHTPGQSLVAKDDEQIVGGMKMMGS